MPATLFPFSTLAVPSAAKRALMALLVDPRIGEVKLYGAAEKIRRVVTSFGAFARLIDQDRTTVHWPHRADAAALFGGVDWEKSITYGRRVESRGFVDRHRGSIVLRTIDESDRSFVDPIESSARHAVIADGAVVLLLGLDRTRGDVIVGEFSFDLGGADPSDLREEPIAMILGDDARWADDIRRARAILANVAIAPPLLESLLAGIGVDRPFGHATDLCIVRTARAFAALAGRRDVLSGDIDAALAAAGIESKDEPRGELPRPNDDRDRGSADDLERNRAPSPNDPAALANRETTENRDSTKKRESTETAEDGTSSSAMPTPREPDRMIAPRDFAAPHIDESPTPSRVIFAGGGPRGDSRRGRGPAGRASVDRRDRTLSTAATLLRAIAQRPFRPVRPGVVVNVRAADLVFRRPRARRGTLFIFVVDGSGSMARRRMAEAKGAIVRLLAEAYMRRDAVALIAVRGERAQLLLEPTGAVARARRELEVLPTGGPTPLSSGLIEARALVDREKRTRRCEVVVCLVTDGQANRPVDHRTGEPAESRRIRTTAEIDRLAALWRAARIRTIVIDPTPGRDPKSSASRLAHLLQADYFRMPDLDAARLENVVRKVE